jgi:hypothetical protein
MQNYLVLGNGKQSSSPENFPTITQFYRIWRTFGNTWNFWWNRRLITVVVKVRPMLPGLYYH